VLIAQISDLHIKPAGLRAYQRVDTAAALARCIKELNRLTPRPDLVVISGDLVDAPSEPAYDHLLGLLSELDIPFAAIPGNHDDRDLMRVALPDCYARPTGPLHATRAIRDVDVVLIDSVTPGRDYGMLEAASLAWLETVLKAAPTRPALLFMHHPPFVTGIGHMDVQNLRNANDLAPILRRHRRARLVAAGHVHRAALTSFAGAAATICPAPNHAVALDLDGRLPPSFTIEPPAFHLHVWSPSEEPGEGSSEESGEQFGTIVTHWVPIGDFDGPHRFFDDHGALL
jgi:3',5'-cyclic AMP phosphodiesterase CpdA